MEETIVRGRYPSGPEYVDVQHLHGSAQAKERLRVILETMMGQRRVGEACERLGICEQRFRQLRAELLQAALERLEGRPAGRPRRPEEPQQIAALRRQLEEMQRELHVAQVREEIALALPRVAAASAAEQRSALQKKG
jgi:helix-turn-helix protein